MRFSIRLFIVKQPSSVKQPSGCILGRMDEKGNLFVAFRRPPMDHALPTNRQLVNLNSTLLHHEQEIQSGPPRKIQDRIPYGANYVSEVRSGGGYGRGHTVLREVRE